MKAIIALLVIALFAAAAEVAYSQYYAAPAYGYGAAYGYGYAAAPVYTGYAGYPAAYTYLKK
uniref:Uncharacterized protein n=1 Tax=Tetranychus urticae TaxID=32264 RepID=T1K8G8_TETUR